MTLSFEGIIAALTLAVQLTALFYGYDRENAERFRGTATWMKESFCHFIAIGSETVLIALYRCWGFVKIIYLKTFLVWPLPPMRFSARVQHEQNDDSTA